MANIAPAKLGQDENKAIYSSPSKEYEQNKNLDLIYGNKDGAISLKEYKDFILRKGNEEGFRQYNPKPPVLQSNLNLNPNYRPVVANAGAMQSLQTQSSPSVTIANAPPQMMNGGTSGGQQRGQARADGSPAVHSTIPSSLFVNVINNRYLSVVV